MGADVSKLTNSEGARVALWARPFLEQHPDTIKHATTILINEVWAFMERDKMTITDVTTCREDIALAIQELAFLRAHGLCQHRHVKQIIAEIWETPYWEVSDVLTESKLLDELDEGQLVAVIQTVIANNPKAIEQINKGKVAAVGALIGQVMKTVKADPVRTRQLLHEHIGIPLP